MAEQQPIDDALLGKFLAGETNPAESMRVRQWLVEQPGTSTEPSHDDFAKFERIWELTGKQRKVINPPVNVDTDAAWERVRQQMHTNQAVPTETEPLPNKRIGQRINYRQTMYRVAAVLVLAASFGWLTYQFRRMGQDHPQQHMVTLVTNDQKISKTLPDGSRIVLNRHSTFTYPTGLAEGERNVTLTGEAFFDVTPDPTRPFQIQARTGVVQVLGTSFSVRAYDTDVSVAVRTGKVRFSAGHKTVVLTKNQQATFEAKADTIRRSLQLSPNVFAYQTSQLVFNKEPLRDVVRAINQHYGSDIELASASIENCRLTTRFDKMPLETVLEVVSESLNLQVRRNGKHIVLDGKGCR